MGMMLPKVLEIERHQLADYARVDYAITQGEDEVAALEELCLGPNELRPRSRLTPSSPIYPRFSGSNRTQCHRDVLSRVLDTNWEEKLLIQFVRKRRCNTTT